MRRLVLYFVAFLLYSTQLYAVPNLGQTDYRWRNDDGDEVTATWAAASNTPAAVTTNGVVRLRIELYNNGLTAATINQQLEYSSNGGATWATMANNAATDSFLYVSSTFVTDGTPTTAQSTATTPGTFVAGKIITNPGATPAQTLAAGSKTEYEWVIGPNASLPPLSATTYLFRPTGLNVQPTTYAALTYLSSPTGCYGSGSLTATNITTTSADLGWTEYGPAVQWQIEYGVGASYALGTGTRVITSNNPYTLTTTPSTTYSYFVRSICGPNDTSAWSQRSPTFGTLASCDTPTAPLVTNITTTTAELDWTENGFATQWEIEYAQGATFTIGSGTREIVNAKPYTLGVTTPLLPGTTYSYYVRSICGPNDTSAWSPVQASFSTRCNPITTLPFTETFETTSPTLVCWQSIDGNNDGDRWTTYTGYSHTGTTSAGMYTDGNGGNNSDWFISPPITLTGTQRLRYWYSVRSTSEPNDYTVKLSTLTDDTLDFTNVLKPLTSVSNTTYQEDIIDLTGYTGTVYISFHVPAGGLDGWYLYIDDFRVEDIPACPDPLMLTSANATTTTADLDWTEPGSATLWEIEYATGTSFTPGTGTREIVSSKPHVVGSTTPLAPGTVYSYFARSICGPNDTSVWSSRASFATVPVNDACIDAIPVILNAPPVTYSNVGATDDPLPALTCGSTSATTGNNKGVWFSFTAPYTGTFTFSGCDNAQMDNYARIYEGSCGSFTACAGFNDDDCPLTAAPVFDFSGVANTTYYILVGNFGTTTATGTFPIQIITPLDIKLGNIAAVNAGNANKITWNTHSEEASDKFELERSIDGKTFTRIFEQHANGKASRYTYMDNHAAKGMNHYRLRMISANGGVNYSETVTAFVKSTGFEVEAFPNPVSHELTIKVSGMQGTDATIQVTDITGTIVKTVKMNGNIQPINMSGMANGIYLIKYMDSNHQQTVRVTKQ